MVKTAVLGSNEFVVGFQLAGIKNILGKMLGSNNKINNVTATINVLAGLKQDKKLLDVPVILLTNLSQKADVDKGLKLGADDYLIKAHFMPSEVVAKIKKLVK